MIVTSDLHHKIRENYWLHFITSGEFVGKTGLLIGLGESASDISYNIAAVARNVCIVARAGPGALIPRYYCGLPTDIGTTSLQSTKSASSIWAIRQFGAKYQDVSVTGLDEDGAMFDDSDRYDCDVIINCSGSQQAFPFLLPDFRNLSYRNDLWKNRIHPKYGESISFVGFARSAVGATPHLTELQERFVALMIAKRIVLPSVSKMMDIMKKDRDYEECLFPFDYKRLSSLCSYLETMTDWSHLTGSDIPMWNPMLQDPKLFHQIIFGQMRSSQYNLFRTDKETDCKEVRSSLLITSTIPVVVQLYEFFILTGAATIPNFGLSEPPSGFLLSDLICLICADMQFATLNFRSLKFFCGKIQTNIVPV